MKNCNFDIQILIQSNKENISEIIEKIKKQKEIEKGLNNIFMLNNFEQYIKYIEEKNKEKLSSSKNFFIIISSKKSLENQEENILDLKDKYLKIKDSLSRCGNTIIEIREKEEIKNIIMSFLKK